MKILITGSNGHIGSYLVRFLIKKNKNISLILIDNFSTQRYSSIFNLPKIKKIKFIEADVSKYNLKNIIKNIDFVIHLAAITNAQESFINAKKVHSNNYNCTKKIANECLKYNKKLIFISSTSVYGTQKKIVDEFCDKKDLFPQSPYALTKLKEEKYLISLSKKKLKVIIFRFGTIYGPSEGMRFHTAVNKFCWQAAMGQPITVWKSAYEQYRPYLDLNDASRAILHSMTLLNFNGDIFNILTNNTTVKNIIKIIKNEIPRIKIKKVHHKIMNQLSYEVSNKRFKSTGFKFNGSIEKSIIKTLNLIKNANKI